MRVFGSCAALVIVACGGGSSPMGMNDAGGSDSAMMQPPADGAVMDSPTSDAPITKKDGGGGKACTGCPPVETCDTCWSPAQGARWQYQLQNGVNAAITAVPYSGGAAVAPAVFDIDLYASDGTTPDSAGVTAIHNGSAHALCYVDAGTYENFRPDAADYTTFDKACSGCLLGKTNGWPGEQWLDVNNDKGQRDFILKELGARLDKCVAAHFDGVEWDNVDGYSNDTGYTITAASQEYFNAAIANLAHEKGLSVALKNDVDQVADLEPYFDYAVNEQCFEFTECDSLQPFLTANKAVFNVEYNKQPATFCAQAESSHMSSIKKDLALDATPYTPCN